MANVNSTPNPSERKVRFNKRSTKIDMTPMVDLAFLLLTFFILTTTFIKPHIMQVDMPDPTGDSSPITEANVMHVVLAAEGKVYCWTGDAVVPVTTDLSRHGFRKILSDRIQTHPRTMVLIKPMDDAPFSHVVDMLDEMSISGVSRYTLADMTEGERAVIGAKASSLPVVHSRPSESSVIPGT